MPNQPYELVADVAQHYDRNTGKATTASDWVRIANSDNIRVNGIALSNLPIKTADGKKLKDYGASLSEAEVSKIKIALGDFFKSQLLNKMPVDEEKKAEIVDYLINNFHQGGLQRFLAFSLGNLVDAATKHKYSIGDYKIIDMDFVSTVDGFDIVELGRITRATVFERGKGPKLIEPEGGIINIEHSRVEIDFMHPDPSFSTIEPTIKHTECELECLNKEVNKALLAGGVIQEAPKWQKFHSKHSPVSVDMRDSSVMPEDKFVAVWQKAVSDNRMVVNGVRLNLHDHGEFNSYEGISRFIGNELLKDLSGPNKLRAQEELMAHFRKEGALSAVSKGVENLLKENYTICDKPLTDTQQRRVESYGLPVPSDIEIDSTINMVSTPRGVDIQEKVQVKRFKVNEAGGERDILPDVGKNHVMKCQASFAVDLTQVNIAVNTTSKTVSYGSTELSQNPEIDQRSMIQKFTDRMGRAFGRHGLTNLTADQGASKPAGVFEVDTDTEPTARSSSPTNSTSSR